MASVLCDVTLWLEHAMKVRALSEVISDPEEKQQMLVVADGFDRIAQLAGEQGALQEQYHYSTDRSLVLGAARHDGHARMPPGRLGAPARS